MQKHYEYFDAKGNVKSLAAIACDKCGVDCEAESWLVNGEEDVCPECDIHSGEDGRGREAGDGGASTGGGEEESHKETKVPLEPQKSIAACKKRVAQMRKRRKHF
jgi:hypothetical protein